MGNQCSSGNTAAAAATSTTTGDLFNRNHVLPGDEPGVTDSEHEQISTAYSNELKPTKFGPAVAVLLARQDMSTANAQPSGASLATSPNELPKPASSSGEATIAASMSNNPIMATTGGDTPTNTVSSAAGSISAASAGKKRKRDNITAPIQKPRKHRAASNNDKNPWPMSNYDHEKPYNPYRNGPHTAAYLGFKDEADFWRWSLSPPFLKYYAAFLQIGSPAYRDIADTMQYVKELRKDEIAVPESLRAVQEEWSFNFSNTKTKTVYVEHKEQRQKQLLQHAYILKGLVEEGREKRVQSDAEKDKEWEVARLLFERETGYEVRPADFKSSDIKVWPVWTHKGDLSDAEKYNRAYQYLRSFGRVPFHTKFKTKEANNDETGKQKQNFANFWTGARPFKPIDVTDCIPMWMVYATSDITHAIENNLNGKQPPKLWQSQAPLSSSVLLWDRIRIDEMAGNSELYKTGFVEATSIAPMRPRWTSRVSGIGVESQSPAAGEEDTNNMPASGIAYKSKPCKRTAEPVSYTEDCGLEVDDFDEQPPKPKRYSKTAQKLV